MAPNHPTPIDEVLESFYAEHKIRGSAERTVRFYRVHAEQFIRDMEVRTTADWHAEAMNRFLLRKSDTCSTGGLFIHYRVLRTLSNWMTRRKYLSENPMPDVVQPKKNRDKPQPFTPEQVRALFRVAKKAYNRLRAEAMLMVLLDTGIRAGELASLRLEDIDYRNRCLNVRGKTGERNVPISPKALRTLKRYIDRERTAPNSVRNVFVSRDGLPVVSPYVTRYMHYLCKRAGIDKKYRGPHAMRHTFAVEYLRSGGDLFSLKEILGHASLEMTERYVSLTTMDLRLAHNLHSPVKKLL